ncbi:MAG: ribbon-helix-helix protein, CopG family [Acidimicrobiales bacterium]
MRRTSSGVVLTHEVEAALAEEAEAGYDLDLARRWRPGRPSLSEGVSPRIHLRIEPELAEALRRVADDEHRSVSALARDALRAYVDSH